MTDQSNEAPEASGPVVYVASAQYVRDAPPALQWIQISDTDRYVEDLVSIGHKAGKTLGDILAVLEEAMFDVEEFYAEAEDDTP